MLIGASCDVIILVRLNGAKALKEAKVLRGAWELSLGKASLTTRVGPRCTLGIRLLTTLIPISCQEQLVM